MYQAQVRENTIVCHHFATLVTDVPAAINVQLLQEETSLHQVLKPFLCQTKRNAERQRAQLRNGRRNNADIPVTEAPCKAEDRGSKF